MCRWLWAGTGVSMADYLVEPGGVFDVVIANPVADIVVIDGPAGPPGPPASAFTYTQATPAATWTVAHTLGHIPNSSEIVIGAEVVEADVLYPNATTVVVVFANPQSGVLRLT